MRPAAWLMCVMTAATAACTGTITDDTPTDGGATADGTRVDGGGQAGPDGSVDCTAAGACPCSTNYDCPATAYCHAETETRIYCMPGTRGTGLLGAGCTGERDCKSGVCITPAGGTPTCSEICPNGNECMGSVLPSCTVLNTTPPAKICLAN